MDGKKLNRSERTELRYRSIWEDSLCGMSVRSLSQKYSMTQNHIRYILNLSEGKDYVKKRHEENKEKITFFQNEFIHQIYLKGLRQLKLEETIVKHAGEIKEGNIPDELIPYLNFNIRKSKNKKGETHTSTQFHKNDKDSILDTILKGEFQRLTSENNQEKNYEKGISNDFNDHVKTLLENDK